MGAKIKGLTDQNEKRTTFVFWCPGCEDVHPYRVALSVGEGPEFPVWDFNGDLESPTFSPSLLVNGQGRGKRCHLFLTKGELQFLADCQHPLAGKTVPCPEWDDSKF